jgi:hypothetical protein
MSGMTKTSTHCGIFCIRSSRFRRGRVFGHDLVVGRRSVFSVIPAIRRPSSRWFVVAGSRSPTMRPSNITAIRSDIDMISSSSTDTRRIALPASRSSMMRWWMNSIAPMSTPRVGWPTSRRSGLRSISRASTIFCWLPPEKFLAASQRVRGADVEAAILPSASRGWRRCP